MELSLCTYYSVYFPQCSRCRTYCMFVSMFLPVFLSWPCMHVCCSELWLHHVQWYHTRRMPRPSCACLLSRARALCETSLPHFHGLHRTVSPELRHCCATCSTALFTCDTSPRVQICRYVCFYRLLCLILQQQIQDSGSSLALFVGPLHVQPVL